MDKVAENFGLALAAKWNNFCYTLRQASTVFTSLSFRRTQAMSVIWFILFGLIVGLIARALMPGRQPMGFILTALLGMAGSFVGGYLGSLIAGGDEGLEVSDPYNWIGAVLGTLLLLFLYGMVAGRKTSV
jgi:uncharacterized membrane protein YeaQ/YmgE (transglycosylase-associated protein family)